MMYVILCMVYGVCCMVYGVWCLCQFFDSGYKHDIFKFHSG